MNNQLPHILNTSANLLGVCFFIITGIQITSLVERELINQIVFLASFGFLVSIFLSYLSIRTHKNTYRFERFADYFLWLESSYYS